ncbi:MAG: ribosomal protein S5, partial [Paramarteilia canceri]
QNPIQVLLVAIQNSAIREDKCRTGRSTMSKPSSVDVPPYRALSKSIYYLCAGARKASLKSRKTFSEHLAEEIINAAKNLSSSYAIKKKDECERTAMASR